MTVREYIEKKNELTLKYAGVKIVPEEQIVDMEPVELGSIPSACPYCLKYYGNDCEGCPMDEAGNNCIDSDSTWMKFVRIMRNEGWLGYRNERDKLVDEYNKSNGFK